jgi:EpsI family protein
MVVGLLAAATSLRLMSHGDPIPLAKPLAQFPAAIGSWHGQDVPIDQALLKVAGVDEYLNRTYEDRSAGFPIFLYVGYYRTQQTGEEIHSPENCLPGAGWQPESRTVLQLPLPEGGTVPVNLYVIQKGLDREAVVYWYQSNGRILASEYWAKIYLVLDTIRYHRTDAALVRVVTPMGKDAQSAYERVTTFAQRTMVPLQNILPR